MGLPRYLDNQRKEWIKNKELNLEHGIYLSKQVANFIVRSNLKFKDEDFFSIDKMSMENIVGFYLKFVGENDTLENGTKPFKECHIINNCHFHVWENSHFNDNSFKKKTIEIFTYFEKQNGKWVYHRKNFKMSKSIHWLIERKNNAKKESEWLIIQKREELESIKNIEQGRIFKGRLRQMILERDNYKCVLCGKSAEDNIKLEIDHIKPWGDGGKTMYDNGRTVCSDCNKGLHHFKKFKEKELEFQAMAF